MRETRGTFGLIGSTALIAAGMLAALISWQGGGAMAQTEQPASVATCAATSLTFSNQNSFPIWIGEGIQTGAVLTPPNSDWKIDAGGSFSLCAPTNWTSGTFWARTECDFEDLYQSGTANGNSRPGAFTTCNSSTDCSSLATTTGNTYDCFGGVCMADCSTSPNNTNFYCQSQMGIPGNPDAICNTNTGNTKISVCSYPNGVVCKMGDCGGQWQCQGTWDTLSSTIGPETPASQFEITNNSVPDGGKGASTYDVTNLAGYNNPIAVTVDNKGADGGPACVSAACNADLNSVCPSLLQVIEPPTGSSGTCGTNNATCQTGVCEPCPVGANPLSCNGSSTCVIGCNGPGKLCNASYPSPISAPGVAGLECTTTIQNGSVHGIPFTADGSQYRDMYDAANDSGAVSKANPNVTMFSGNHAYMLGRCRLRTRREMRDRQRRRGNRIAVIRRNMCDTEWGRNSVVNTRNKLHEDGRHRQPLRRLSEQPHRYLCCGERSEPCRCVPAVRS